MWKVKGVDLASRQDATMCFYNTGGDCSYTHKPPANRCHPTGISFENSGKILFYGSGNEI